MPKLKLYFILIYVQNLFAYRNKYCEICPNHTLCKYEIPGPNPLCIGYDNNSMLKSDEINTIVNQINKRRNFIAMGESKYFHAAANMKKISWSNELAVFAQRWVDQCDQSLRPDREDECRDLEHTKVGQSIATITGPSPGMNVKSFVEMWFMLSIDYVGSVTYYNQSEDYKANYFTQLIWANTDKVGCGRAKFYVRDFKTTSVDRLVCNFAPRGNLHRKPIYTIGYPATQCSDDMTPDKKFPGLCAYSEEKTDRLSSEKTVATSLLRIRNIFNDSAKQEIDPVYSNLKPQMVPDKDTVHSYKNHHILNNPYDAIKRSYPLDYDTLWINQRNKSRKLNDDPHEMQNRGHSKVYHDHDHTDEFDSLHPKPTFEDSRRYNFPTLYKQQGSNRQCTRRAIFDTNKGPVSTCECIKKLHKCTRGQTTHSQSFTKYCPSYFESTTYPSLNDACACGIFQTRCQNTKVCMHNRKCDCATKCHGYNIPDMLKSLKNNNDDDLYDMPLKDVKQYNKDKELDSTITENFRRLNKRKDRIYDYSDVTTAGNKFKPFWQIDNSKMKQKHLPLRSLLYTTLPNKKLPRSKRTRSTFRSIVTTEPITIKNLERHDKINRMTEKYLSFDELMHLRKFNSTAYSGRRRNDDDIHYNEGEKLILRDATTTTTTATTTATVSTSEYTANTPYIRLKYCTRKLTCTWTAASLTDNEGSIIPGHDSNYGSHTPPGYVEGCTRTSTCTRDFMNRNKMDTVSIETTTAIDTNDDEDYCERRSLNKRNANTNNSIRKHRNILHYTTGPVNLNYYKVTTTKYRYYNIRNNNKRHLINHIPLVESRQRKSIQDNINKKLSRDITLLSYGDLYYNVLQKILNTWKQKPNKTHTTCFCNNVDKLKCSHLILLITMILL